MLTSYFIYVPNWTRLLNTFERFWYNVIIDERLNELRYLLVRAFQEEIMKFYKDLNLLIRYKALYYSPYSQVI